MPKVRTTSTLDERVLRALRVRAAREGRADGELIEAALRRDLGFDLLQELWAANVGETEAEVQTTVAEALRAVRLAAKTPV